MMPAQRYEELRIIMYEWMQSPKFYSYHLKQVFGNEYIVYFVNSVTIIRDNINLPISITSGTFDLRQADAANNLTKVLKEFDDVFQTYVESRLDEFPNGAIEFS